MTRPSTFALPLTVLLIAAVAPADEPKAAPRPRGVVTVTDEARRIHSEAIVIDGHNDLPWELRRKSNLAFETIDISKPQPRLHTDIARLRAGGVGAQFWSVYVPATTMKTGTAIKTTLEQIDVVQRMIRRYPDTFVLALSVDDILRARKEGKIASLIGIEGGHSIDNSLGVLRMMHALGVRYMTLTHSVSLDWAEASPDEANGKGLSQFGEQVVAEMNRLGMLVDISHVSPSTMKHTLRVTRAPVIASHSSARALADHHRNVPDDVLKLVAQNGGVIMVNFFPGFIFPEGARAAREMYQVERRLREQIKDDKQYEEALRDWMKEHPIPKSNVHTVVDHIVHIAKVAGIDHVGLGSDYDGITTVPEQLEDVSTYPVITQALLDRGYTKEQIHKVLGGNLLRAMRQMEALSAAK